MWFAAFAGLQGLGALGEYAADKAQAKAQKRLQAYKNKMTHLSNAVNQDTITTNEVLTIQQSARTAVFQKRDEMGATGSAVVAAAAAGVRGNSVNQTLVNIQRNAGFIEQQRTLDLVNAFKQYDQQRLNSAMSAVMQQDLSYIPKPSLSSYLFKAAGNIASQGMSMG